nr:Cysteine rich PDZ binding protein [Hymenolepis microstoma]
MVCGKCEKKLVKIATPDPWKVGSRGAGMKAKKRLNENKLLTGGKGRYNPHSAAFKKCRICGQSVHQPEAHYCQSCAFKKGICAMCGVRLVNTSNYNQCAV